MKLKPLNNLKLAALGLAGLALVNSVHATVIFTDDFESIPVPSSPGYLYGAAGGWNDNNLVNGNWWYDSAYAAANNRSAPFGNIALHTKSSYKFRSIGTTFVAGQTYRLTARASIDLNDTDGRIFLYFGIDGTGTINDGNSLGRGAFEGTGASALGGATFASDSSDWEGANAGNWGTLVLEYVAQAADDGQPIAIGVWGRNDSGVDNLVVEVVPEPGSAALLGLGALGLIARRRRR